MQTTTSLISFSFSFLGPLISGPEPLRLPPPPPAPRELLTRVFLALSQYYDFLKRSKPRGGDFLGERAPFLPFGLVSSQFAAGGKTSTLPQAAGRLLALPFAYYSFVLIRQGVPAEGQHHQPRAVDQHHGAAPVWIHPHFGDVDVLHEAVLREKNEGSNGFTTYLAYGVQVILNVRPQRSLKVSVARGDI